MVEKSAKLDTDIQCPGDPLRQMQFYAYRKIDRW
jgi:hypothetical protein